jgi:hypothetical protein
MEPGCANRRAPSFLEIGRLSLHRDREPLVLPAVVLVMSRIKNVLAVVSIGLATISSAWTQTIDSKACTEQEHSNQTLSEKLGQTHGVICPPDIDRGMKAPTPDAGKTPVIPPPGSPGGNPNVQPK